jgi:hypothetical protein
MCGGNCASVVLNGVVCIVEERKVLIITFAFRHGDQSSKLLPRGFHPTANGGQLPHTLYWNDVFFWSFTHVKMNTEAHLPW